MVSEQPYDTDRRSGGARLLLDVQSRRRQSYIIVPVGSLALVPMGLVLARLEFMGVRLRVYNMSGT